MNRHITTVVIIMCAVTMAHSQSVPDAPSHARVAPVVKPTNVYLALFRQPEFYVSVGTFAASEYYDIHSTKVCELARTCVEAYPGHDRYTYALPLVGLVAAGTYGCQLILHDHKWYRRFICPGLGIGMSVIHWQDGSTIYHESRIARR